ncbi:Endonuclease YncB, thermonuclease family [Rhizobiales bacterium GAS113]|nr:Endonuclease YncB, thermonuclease family [Rhizobiales bacterium GAS113]
MGAIAVAGLVSTAGHAQQQPPSYPLAETGVSLATGDSWAYGGQRFRLYGVQSCLRGTFFTNGAGQRADCGEASLAYLAAVLKDTRPTCSGIARLSSPADSTDATILVVCSAKVGSNMLDLGTILIAEGFAFAAYSNDGKPAYLPYAVAEREAARRKAGLWAFADLPHPTEILINAARRQ